MANGELLKVLLAALMPTIKDVLLKLLEDFLKSLTEDDKAKLVQALKSE